MTSITFNYEGRESLVHVSFHMTMTAWVELYMGAQVQNNNTSKVPGNLPTTIRARCQATYQRQHEQGARQLTNDNTSKVPGNLLHVFS